MPRVLFQPYTMAIPPIKLDGKVYIVMTGTYQRLKNEKIITARYTDSGGIDLQKVNTEKHRWKMTLLVPTSTSNVTVSGAAFSSSDMGTVSDLQATFDKMSPDDLLAFYDIDREWVFAGEEPYSVYIDSMDKRPPNNDDIGTWQVPITLWGYDKIPTAPDGGMDLGGWVIFMVGSG